MNNKDIIQRFIFEELGVRGEIVRLNESFQTIVNQHSYPPIISKLLGELLASACLLSAIIKFKGRLTVQFQGKNPLKLLLAQCNDQFNIRGLAQWQPDLTDKNLLSLLQQGLLAILINPDSKVSGYQGIVNWQGNSLAQSIEGYFRDSEQLPTRLWLAIDDTSVVGLLLQVLPAEGTKKTNPVFGNKDWEHIVHLSDTITSKELLSLDNQTILHRLYSQEEVRLFSPVPIKFGCNCSIARSENAILLLGKKEAEEELEKKQKIMVTCEFCNHEYTFDRVDVANIFKKGDQSTSSQVH